MTKAQPIQLQARYCPKCKTKMTWCNENDLYYLDDKHTWECPKCSMVYSEGIE